MIDKSKNYTTRDGRAVRIYETGSGGQFPVHGAVWLKDENRWISNSWRDDGYNFTQGQSVLDLVSADPHGIIPSHRELLAGVIDTMGVVSAYSKRILEQPFWDMGWCEQAALRALAKLDEQHKGGG